MSANWKVICSLLFLGDVLAALKGQRDMHTLPAWAWKYASIECKWYSAVHNGYSNRMMAANISIPSFDLFHRLHHSWALSCSIWNQVVVVVREAVAGISLSYQSIKAANCFFLDVCNHCHQDHWRFNTNNHCHTVDTRCQDWVGRV